MDFLVHHMLRRRAESAPDQTALVDRQRRLTFAELATRVAGVARGLRQAGLRRGDRVGVLLGPSVEQVVAILAVSEAGGVFVPMHHGLFANQARHVVGDCTMRALVTTSARVDELESAEEASSLEFVVVTDEPRREAPASIGVYPMAALAAEPGATAHCDDWAIGKDLAALLYTSGSTGRPKGVMLSHANVLAGARIVASYLGIGPGDRTLAALPFSFDAGLNQLMTGLLEGATVVLLRLVTPAEIVRVLSAERITGLAGVPTLWSQLVNGPCLDQAPLPDLRYVTNTGGALPQPVLAALRRKLPGTRVILMYGLTEAFRSTYLPPEELDRRPTSMGRAIPDTEILVVDEDGRPCAPGEVGELVHRGPTVSLGYWGHPGLTRRVFRPHPFAPPALDDSERVCYSGDLVTQDADGYLYFVGRRDNMIKSSGFRISPTEVESILLESDCVEAAAVIGVPDALLGQAVQAFVVAKAAGIEGDAADEERLRAHCAARVPAHMVPRRIGFLDGLPVTSSGKVDYAALRRRAADADEGPSAAVDTESADAASAPVGVD